MEFTWLALLFLLTIIYYCFIYSNKITSSNLPPGPKPIPFLGNLHLLGDKPHVTLTKLREKFGDVFSFKFGSYNGVVLNGHEAIREALTESAFNGRHLESAAFPREGGIVFSEDKEWAEQRRFTLKTLRDFGFGKKSMETLIKDEVQELIDNFRKDLGKPNNFQLIFNVAVLNTLWSIMTGQRFSHDDPQLQKLIGMLNTAIQSVNLTILEKLSFFVSWLHPLKLRLATGRQMTIFMDETMKLMKGVIQQHRESYQKDQLRDFIDVYLNAIDSASTESTFYGSRGEHNLPIVLFEMFVAGTETTASTLTYALQYLALHPPVQEKMFLEIQNEIGQARQPSLADRPNLPFCEATIFETLRHSSLLPRSLLHKTTEDVTFRGFFIPKDTIVVPNLHSAMHDQSVWGDPENFRPERFISKESGALERHHEALLPFSYGKRVCLGESLARDQLFLFLTNLVQQFRFKPHSVDFTRVEYVVTPLILSPVPKMLVLEDRAGNC